MFSKSTITIAALLALSACATGNSPRLASSTPAFACPTGVTVDRGDEGTSEYIGQSGKEGVCIIKEGRRKVQAHYGLYPVDADGATENADALSGIFPLEVGKRETAVWTSQTTTGVYFYNRYKVASLADVTVLAGTFRAYELQVSRSKEARSGSGTPSETSTTYWIDSVSGATIKKTVEFHGGVAMDSGAFTAERTSRPIAAQPVAVSQ